ncbi:MAG: metalloregulator ArsR/SmtB family transcription factor [Rectinemataceae bacterium]
MADLKSDISRASAMSELLKALAHPIRLMIVAQLLEGEANVSELAERLDVPQPLASQQLRILRMVDLVDFSRKDGFAVYRITQPRLAELLHCLEGCHPGSN